jgi:hypothetical protein
VRAFVIRSSSQHGHLPHLRRLKIYLGAYPVLPHWATIFRASSAESRATVRILKSIPTKLQRRGSSDRARAPEARHNLAQPGRAGNGGNHDFKHRRCDTFRLRAIVLRPTLKTRATRIQWR